MLLSLAGGAAFAQSPKKSSGAWYTAIRQLDTNELKQGRHLELARDGDIAWLVKDYIWHGPYRQDLKYGFRQLLRVYEDSGYVYFVVHSLHGNIRFFRIPATQVLASHYEELHPNTLPERFFAEIMPERDKKRYLPRGWHEAEPPFKFEYRYLPESSELEMRGFFTGYGAHVGQLYYIARYNPADRSLRKVELDFNGKR